MSNMKFAIRKLAMTCILPATLFHGPLILNVSAQDVPSAISKANVGLPARKTTPARSNKSSAGGAASPSAKPTTITNAGQVAATQGQRTPAPKPGAIRQVANTVPKPGTPNGGESDVQRQLRMLYEKSGQEMPAMSLDEMEVPEPQAGVRPGGAGPRTALSGQESVQPPKPPQKAPNLFERIFLGKKMPPPAPTRTMPQQPRSATNGQFRQGNPSTVSPNVGQPRSNYRPFQAGQPYQTGQLGGASQRPLDQTGINGQSPGMISPQTSPQRPPAAIPPTVRPNASTRQVPTLQPLDEPAFGEPERESEPAGLPALDEVPLLEEPDESLEIELNPKARANSSEMESAPVISEEVITPNEEEATSEEMIVPEDATVSDDVVDPDNVVVPDKPAPTEADSAGDSLPAEPTDMPVEENPFSGLELSVPEPVETEQVAPDASTSDLPVPKSTLVPNTAVEEDPFLESPVEAPVEEPILQPTPTAPPREVDVPPNPTVSEKPVSITEPPATQKNTTIPAEVNPFQEQSQSQSATNPVLNDRLKQLAEAREKTGLKGFCPVALRQQRQLIATRPQFFATYRGQKYHFSTSEAQATFAKSPELFAPAHSGQDAIALLDDEKSLPGTLDHSAWFQGRLYLFANRKNLDAFHRDPEGYLDEEDLEDLTVNSTSGPADQTQASPPAEKPTTRGSVASPPVTLPSVTISSPEFEDLPVLPENLDDLQPIAPPAVKPQPLKIQAVKPQPEIPAEVKSVVVKPRVNSAERSRGYGPSKFNPRSISPKVIAPEGPKLEAISPPARNEAHSGTPKLISPDLQLIPSTPAEVP